MIEDSTAENLSSSEPSSVQPFTTTEAVEAPIVTLVLSRVQTVTQSSSGTGKDVSYEDNRLSDDNENSYEKDFALDCIITSLDRLVMKVADKRTENG